MKKFVVEIIDQNACKLLTTSGDFLTKKEADIFALQNAAAYAEDWQEIQFTEFGFKVRNLEWITKEIN